METETTLATIKLIYQDLVRLDRFDGSNFIRWQDKLKFLSTMLKIFDVLDPNLEPIANATKEDIEEVRTKRENVRG